MKKEETTTNTERCVAPGNVEGGLCRAAARLARRPDDRPQAGTRPKRPDSLSIRLASAATLCAFDPGGTFHHPRHGLRAHSATRSAAAATAAAETPRAIFPGLIEHNVNIITPHEMSERI